MIQQILCYRTRTAIIKSSRVLVAVFRPQFVLPPIMYILTNAYSFMNTHEMTYTIV